MILFYLWYNRNLCLVFGLGKAFLAVYSGAPVMLTSSSFPPHWAYAKRLTRPRQPRAVSWPPGRPDSDQRGDYRARPDLEREGLQIKWNLLNKKLGDISGWWMHRCAGRLEGQEKAWKLWDPSTHLAFCISSTCLFWAVFFIINQQSVSLNFVSFSRELLNLRGSWKPLNLCQSGKCESSLGIPSESGICSGGSLGELHPSSFVRTELQ